MKEIHSGYLSPLKKVVPPTSIKMLTNDENEGNSFLWLKGLLTYLLFLAAERMLIY